MFFTFNDYRPTPIKLTELNNILDVEKLFEVFSHLYDFYSQRLKRDNNTLIELKEKYQLAKTSSYYDSTASKLGAAIGCVSVLTENGQKLLAKLSGLGEPEIAKEVRVIEILKLTVNDIKVIFKDSTSIISVANEAMYDCFAAMNDKHYDFL